MARTKLKWLKMRKKTEPEVPYEPPIWMGPISNGEFFKPVTKRDVQIREEILRRADDFSRRAGMDRREFMASAMGMATTLSVFNLASGCGKNGYQPVNAAGDFATPPASPAMGTSAGATAAIGGSGAGTTPAMAPVGPGPTMSTGNTPPPPMPSGTGGMGASPSAGMAGDGGFQVSQDMCMNADMADRLFKKDYFIIDMQTHHLGSGNLSFGMMEGCGTAGSTENDYIRSIFMESDTTVAILSGLPSDIGAGGDLSGFSNMDMVNSRDKINKGFAPGADRMIAHCQTNPYDGPDRNGPMMEKFLTMYKTKGWKCYPPVGNGSTGWWLTDDVSIQFIQKAVELGEPLICAHKGFPISQSWSRMHANPMPDVGKIAMMFPEVNFVIYHSACDSMHPEGPYDSNPDPDNGGSDRLAKVVSEAGLTGQNVYAEMGSAWYLNMRDAGQATHYIGKMLKYVGEDRLVWGSECCWFASPQCQIEAMKAFKMDSGIRDMYMYPDFTDELKRKMFGLTGTKLYRVDPNLCRYQLDRTKVAMEKDRRDDELGPRRWVMNNTPHIKSWRDWLKLEDYRKATGNFV